MYSSIHSLWLNFEATNQSVVGIWALQRSTTNAQRFCAFACVPPYLIDVYVINASRGFTGLKLGHSSTANSMCRNGMHGNSREPNKARAQRYMHLLVASRRDIRRGITQATFSQREQTLCIHRKRIFN